MTRATVAGPDGGGDERDPLFGRGFRPAPGYDGSERRPNGIGFVDVVRQLPRLIALVVGLAWNADRSAVLRVMCCEPLAGVATATALLATNHALAQILAGPPTKARLLSALPTLALVGAAAAAASVLTAVSHAAAGRLGPQVDRVAYTKLLERVVRVELITVEDGEFHNAVSTARRGAMTARTVTERVTQLLGALIGMTAGIGVLGALHPVLLALLPLTLLPRAWAATRIAGTHYASMKAWIEVTRQQEILAEMIVDREAAEEIRAHGLGPFLLSHYERIARIGESEQARLARREAKTNVLADTMAGLSTVATYGVLGALLLTGQIPLAVAGTAVLALRTGTANLGAIVVSFNELFEKGIFLLDWRDACIRYERAAMSGGTLDLPARPAVIEARDVRFTYPGRRQAAVDGVCVTVWRGEVVAFVGENGSGKTTLAKLLTGLYLTDSGTVTWDGVSLREARRQDVFDRVRIVSQNIVQWPFTAALNVTIGRPDRADPMPRLTAAARASGADAVVDGLHDGWDSLLAPEFLGGTALSGGQWQRMALARCWYRDAPIVVFDEPTSALDPKAEVEAFEQVAELADTGHAVLLITHRLASVRRADRIYVLAGGRVAEFGSHAELMEADGEYAAMYRLQAAQYRLEVPG